MNNLLKCLIDGLCHIVYIVLPLRRLNRYLKDKKAALYSYWVSNSFKQCPNTVRFAKIGNPARVIK